MPTTEGKTWGLEASASGDLAPFESGLVAREGRPLATIGGAPAVFARPLGKGWAIYLNTLFDRYPLARKRHFGGAGYRSLVSALLGHVGVGPAIVVRDGQGHGVGPIRIARYKLGDAEIVGLLPEPVDLGEMYGRDGVRVYDDSRLGKVASQEVEIRVPGAGDMTNVRTGEILGRADRLKTSVVAGDALVLAVGPGRPTVALSGPAAVSRGEHPRFAIRLAPSSAKRLVRCHVYGPDGAFLPGYARNLLVDATGATFVLPTALNDAPGSYRLKATDILGGGAAEATVEVR